MDYTKIPANLINKYLWDKAKGLVPGHAKLSDTVWGLDVDTYTYVPFFPVSENTGINAEKPFVTYQSLPRARQGAGDTDYWLQRERMIYTVVAPMPNVIYISNFIHANLSRFDATANAINSHIADPVVVFDSVSAYSINLQDETTDYDSVQPRYQSEIIVDFDYRRVDLET